MDKQQFDHIENRIREAAEHVSPPFDKEAWSKMEALLDKDHKKDRRPLFWWWILLLVLLLGGSGIYISLQKPFSHYVGNKQPNVNVPDVARQGTQGGISGIPQPVNRSSPEHLNASNRDKLPENKMKLSRSSNINIQSHIQSPQSRYPASIFKQPVLAKEAGSIDRKTQPVNIAGKKGGSAEQNLNVLPGKGGNDIPDKEVVAIREKEKDVSHSKEHSLSADTALKAKPDMSEKQTRVSQDSTKNFPATNTPVAVKTKSVSIRLSDNAPSRGLYFLGSIAADGSSVKKLSVKNIEAVYGAGIGYRFNRKISLQAGFYAGRKIYKAGPGDYYFDKTSYLGMVDILKIDADCFVYDIPVSFRYDFYQKKNYSLYGVAGLSSFIMKREDYDYHYNHNGAYHEMASTYTGNKHLFSVMDLSIGFEHKLSKVLFLQAEPYVKVPMAGVGEGKVKLYSGGLQLGLKYQPLKSKRIK